MRRTAPSLALVAITALVGPTGLHAQISSDCWIVPQRDGSPTSPEAAMNRTSPKRSIDFTLGDQAATLCWDAPSVRGREIFGGLQPYGELWRMGANEATSIHLPFAAEIGGIRLEPGSYTIYAKPGRESFEIFVNARVERWGIPFTDDVRENDIGSFTRPVTRIDTPVEQLRFTFESHGEGMGHLVMEWADVRVEIPVHRVM
ncbi:MAG: DUF2911 domain-containing protein [Longimicrobiales bacterium]|nr:DUF2911 domain-containing protein [Longimicrobiales bacterium]